MTATKQADAAMQNGVKGALANYPSPSPTAAVGAVPPTSSSAYPGGTTGLPQFPASPVANNTTAPNTYTTAPNTYTAAPNNAYPNLPPMPTTPMTGAIAAGIAPTGQAPQVNSPSYPGAVPSEPTQGQTSVGSYTTPNSTAAGQPANRYSGVYQPGTTGRSTSYNFGSVSPAQATSPSPAGIPLPPNTASNPPNGVLR